jgi:SHS2 domain-containing protein
MPYRYLDDLTVADVAFEARGGTLEELFTSAWEATLQVMLEDPAALAARGSTESRNITVEESSLELLLHSFLQEAIYYKDAEGLLLRIESCRVVEGKEAGEPARLEARAVGEPIDPQHQRLGTDVKAVTFFRFSLTRDSCGWRATVVLDV